MPISPLPLAPVQPRRRTERRPILRVRTGCFTCRGRKKKCDEVKPVCEGCRRNQLTCRWPAAGPDGEKACRRRVSRRILKASRTTVVALPATNCHAEALQAQTLKPSSRENRHARMSPAPDDHNSSSLEFASLNTTSESHLSSNYLEPTQLSETAEERPCPTQEQRETSSGQDTCLLSPTNIEAAESIPLGSPVNLENECTSDGLVGGLEEERCRQDIILPNPSSFAGLESQSFELMSYYLSRTAYSMGNGATIDNPFVIQLVPLSFTNKLVLELMLSQSAAHRAVSDGQEGATAIAHTYYSKSIRLFRNAVNDYIAGSESSPLWVTIGALMLCFTETAKGDTNGIIFDHLCAVRPLLLDVISKQKQAIRQELKTFMIEYYVYTATISMISIDPAVRATPLLNAELELEAQVLVQSDYIGHLCGCWLPLLLLIPRIFEFGHRAKGKDVIPRFPSPDDFIEFSLLQTEIITYTPSSLAMPEVAVCGLLFQQAVHLYLLTALGQHGSGGLHGMNISMTVSQAILYLDQLPASARINTSLCWALAVIGSCTTDEAQRSTLRERLNMMFLTIGLGNIQSTLILLEHMWQRPEQQQNPWTISDVMQEHEIWISFA